MVRFLEQLINGLSVGSIYALIALGYTMVYGVARMINFAHGDIIMVGAYVLYVCYSVIGLPAIVSLLITIVFCSVLGITIERIAYKPLRKAPSLAVLITAIGMSYLLQALALLIFGANPITFPTIITAPPIQLGSINISGITVIIFIITVICMIGLDYFINNTRAGSAMRAASEDKPAAELMGINVNKTISLVFAIGSALAGVAGILYISQYQVLMPTLGGMPGIKAFVAAVIGGIGSIPGAMLGGILLGVVESLSKAYISTQLSDAIVFGILVLVLLVRPSGLLGRDSVEKV